VSVLVLMLVSVLVLMLVSVLVLMLVPVLVLMLVPVLVLHPGACPVWPVHPGSRYHRSLSLLRLVW